MVRPARAEVLGGDSDVALLRHLVVSTSIITIDGIHAVVSSQIVENFGKTYNHDFTAFMKDRAPKSMYTTLPNGNMGRLSCEGQSRFNRLLLGRRDWVETSLVSQQDGPPLLSQTTIPIGMSDYMMELRPGMRVVAYNRSDGYVPLADSPDHQLLLNLARAGDAEFSTQRLNNTIFMAQIVESAIGEAMKQGEDNSRALTTIS